MHKFIRLRMLMGIVFFLGEKRDTPVLVSLAGTVVVSESFRYPRLVRCSRGQ